MKRPLWLVVALMVGCSNPIFNVNMTNVSLNVVALTNTSQKIVYPTSASQFNKPTLAFSSVKLRGNSSASSGLTVQTVKLFLYSRTTDPKDDAACTSSAGMYLCSVDPLAKLNTVEITLQSDGSKTSFNVNDPNSALKNGINAGKLWLGVEVTQGASLNPTISLTDLVADVTVL